MATQREAVNIDIDDGDWQTVKDRPRVRPASKLTTKESPVTTASTKVPAKDKPTHDHIQPGYATRPIIGPTIKPSSGRSASQATNSNNGQSEPINNKSIRVWRATPPVQPVTAVLLPAEAWPSLTTATGSNNGKESMANEDNTSAAPITNSNDSAAAADVSAGNTLEPNPDTDAATTIEQCSNVEAATAVINNDISAVVLQPPAAATQSMMILPAMDLAAAVRYNSFEFGSLPNLQTVPTLELCDQL